MNYTENLPWVILLLPLCAAVFITLFTLRDGKFSSGVSIAAAVLAFIFSATLFAIQLGVQMPETMTDYKLEWLKLGEVKITIAPWMDQLSSLMTVLVTFVGGAIQIYSRRYMHGDAGMGRYFAGLSFFTFAMLGVVMSSNLVMLFIFWELVGVSSYMLIGFWHHKPAAADAGKKAFIVNRLGDFGFLLGILAIWGLAGTTDIYELKNLLSKKPEALGALGGIVGLLIFCGAMGKSAQFPLHVWLPDAMEGPTPVSALIHAATMVAAGVFMLCRLFFLYQVNPAWPAALSFLNGITPLDIIAWIGGITALLSAVAAIQQNDIKRILAYSTLSQLGYMVMAVGLQGPAPAMFHLCTHAFFKALLFLAAGSIILALHHEQDIWRMGGLRHKMPVTWWTFLVGTLALCGLPPMSGFYSKDSILAAALEPHGNWALFAVGVIVAALTSLYMFRLIFVVFCGAPRGSYTESAIESPKIITVPLIVLAIPSVIAGWIGLEPYLSRYFNTASSIHTYGFSDIFLAPFNHSPLAASLGLLASVMGLSFAYGLYNQAAHDPLPSKLGALADAMKSAFYLDNLYLRLNSLTHEALAIAADWIDRWIISGLGVRGVHGSTEFAGRALRLLQTGNVQTYAFLLAAGTVILLWIKLGH